MLRGIFIVTSIELTLCCRLSLQMRKLRLENATLKQEKTETRKMVEDLKEQIKICLQSAVNKTQTLQKQLDQVTAKKNELEQQLAAIQGREEASIR